MIYKLQYAHPLRHNQSMQHAARQTPAEAAERKREGLKRSGGRAVEQLHQVSTFLTDGRFNTCGWVQYSLRRAGFNSSRYQTQFRLDKTKEELSDFADW
jgi:hypothetical protein